MKIQVCTWKTCKGRFSEYILNRLESDKKFYNLKDVEVSTCPCTWNCKIWPSVMFNSEVENGMNPVKASKMMMDKMDNNNNNNKKKK